jgi:DNA polymerase I-like protein with 3'-5' exonuclease and polymerase domains
MPPAETATALYLDKPEAVERFLAGISDIKELALDTEGASFHKFLDRIYLLQLSTRDRSAIIDPLPIGSPARLGDLVQSKEVEVVFHDADYDLRLLHQDYGWHVTNIFDTRIASQLLGIKSFGLAALLEQFFDVKLDKKPSWGGEGDCIGRRRSSRVSKALGGKLKRAWKAFSASRERAICRAASWRCCAKSPTGGTLSRRSSIAPRSA